MIPTKRIHYDTWETAEGKRMYQSRRFTAQPLIPHLVEYDGFAVKRLLPWTQYAHLMYFGASSSIAFEEDPSKYARKPREVALYLHYVRGMTLTLPVRPTLRESVRAATGKVEPCRLRTFPDVDIDTFREAFVMFTVRHAMRMSGKAWVREGEIRRLSATLLAPVLQELVTSDVIRKTGDVYRFAWVEEQARAFIGHTPPIHVLGVVPTATPGEKEADYTASIDSFLAEDRVVNTMVYPLVPPLPEFEHFPYVSMSMISETLKVDSKNRKILVVSDTGGMHLQPNGKMLIRVVRAFGPFLPDEIVLSEECPGGRAYTIHEGYRGVRTCQISREQLYSHTSIAATATFDDLPFIRPSPSCGYSGVVLIKPRESLAIHPKWLYAANRIGNGDCSMTISLEKRAPPPAVVPPPSKKPVFDRATYRLFQQG